LHGLVTLAFAAQPWDKLFTNWRMITLHHPAFQSFITYEEAEHLLQAFLNKPGRCATYIQELEQGMLAQTESIMLGRLV
jgi:hypothetical protein